MNRKRGYLQNTRLNALRDLLVEKKLSNILLTDSIDVRYLCGFCSSSVSVLISRKEELSPDGFQVSGKPPVNSVPVIRSGHLFW